MADQTNYTDKQGNDVTVEELFKGKSPEQIKALKFFFGMPINEGCFKKEYLTEEAYMEILQAKRGRGNLKDRALQKLGVDESQVKEIDPVCFEGFRYEYSKLNPYTAFRGKTWYSSMYETTWLFFGESQVYVYNHAFDTTDQTASDKTQEYFYKDITAFATSSDNVQRKVWLVESKGCSSTRTSEMKNVNTELFRIVVPGEVFECAYSDKDNAAAKVSAMKQKLREMKQK